MNNDIIIEKLELLKSGLIAVATGGTFSPQEYSQLRTFLMDSDLLKDKSPDFLRFCRNPHEFQQRMKSKFAHYDERREYITDEINKLIYYIENNAPTSYSNVDTLSQLKQLGSGGFGEVFLYHHDILDIDFAMKFFNPVFISNNEQDKAEKRFFREAKILFKLHCDNIVQIYDAGYLDGKPFIRMEYIDGFNLNGLLDKYSILSFSKSITVIREILNGLEYSHKKGIIHRDLKPSNVMFSSSEKKFKIIDFGISAFLNTDDYTKLTRTGEQIAGGSYIDPQLQINPILRDQRSDIYSVGAIWYYLLTGQVPSGADIKNQLKSIAGLDDNKTEIIMKCLSYNLQDRYENCTQLKNILKTL